ncbi:MAG: DNA alkylation repair protein [Rhodobacterales bacterium]|nr:DNA alkylation repair protein [Rhodobacterales bacterium]
MTPLDELQALADPAKAAGMAAYHKATRAYLGVPVPAIEVLTDRWRADLTLDDRLALAASLWTTDIHEARVAAAKLLTQARLRPDDAAWALIQSWVPDFDAWAIADHASIAGQKRLVADPARLATVEAWISSPHMWTRRAALVMTLPWTKQNFPKPADLAVRDRVLGWCATLAADPDWFIQKAIAWWVRDLSRHDTPRARAFIKDHGPRLRPFARTEAARHLSQQRAPMSGQTGPGGDGAGVT